MRGRIIQWAIVSLAWGVTGVACMTYGASFNWPDYVHVNYGFPLAFVTHTLNTIAGPVDKWTVDLGSLATDLAFWSTCTAVIMVVGFYLGSRSNPQG